MTDFVDRIVAQWSIERPDIDGSPMLVFGRIFRIQAMSDPLFARVFVAMGLGEGEFDVLATLRRQGTPFELTAGELHSATMVTTGAITKRVDRLERAGLVERRVDRGDARRRLVRLTAKGRRLVDRAIVAHVENEARMLAALTPAERAQLADLLRKLGASVEAAL